MRLALTDKAVLALQFTASGQQIVRDAELPGFFVMIGTSPFFSFVVLITSHFTPGVTLGTRP